VGQARRFELLAWYWHFVDGVWVAVFTVVLRDWTLGMNGQDSKSILVSGAHRLAIHRGAGHRISLRRTGDALGGKHTWGGDSAPGPQLGGGSMFWPEQKEETRARKPCAKKCQEAPSR